MIIKILILNKMQRSNLHVATLSSSSFQRWKYEISAVLESKDLLDIVLGIDIKPAEGDDKIKQWRMKDASARSIISVTLDEEHHAIIRASGSASDMWSVLMKYRESSTVNNKYLSAQAFHELKFLPEMTVSAYLSEISSIIKQLKNLQMEPSKETILAKIVNDLPKTHDSFRTSWRLGALGGLNLKLEDLQSQLLVHEREISGKGDNVKSHGEALIVHKKRSKFNKRKVRCYSCNEMGSFKRDCPSSRKKLKLNKMLVSW